MLSYVPRSPLWQYGCPTRSTTRFATSYPTTKIINISLSLNTVEWAPRGIAIQTLSLPVYTPTPVSLPFREPSLYHTNTHNFPRHSMVLAQFPFDNKHFETSIQFCIRITVHLMASETSGAVPPLILGLTMLSRNRTRPHPTAQRRWTSHAASSDEYIQWRDIWQHGQGPKGFASHGPQNAEACHALSVVKLVLNDNLGCGALPDIARKDEGGLVYIHRTILGGLSLVVPNALLHV